MNVKVIVAAAGKGKRMEGGINKQYLALEKKPILLHTLMAFDKIKGIQEIVVVIGEGEEALFRSEILERYRFRHKILLTEGGKERQHSIYNGLMMLGPETDIVVIHDGARPLVDQKSILETIRTANRHGAAILAVPVKDTIKVVDHNGIITDTPVRSLVWAAQTPQTFRYDLIMRAYEKAMADDFLGTDDAMLVERLGESVKVVLGSYDNMKITTPHDLIAAEQVLRRRK